MSYEGADKNPTYREAKESIANKMELETELMRYGCSYLHISESEWVKCYAKLFDDMYKDPASNIQERFGEVYDTNPEEFYRQLHQELYARAL